jgi:DNA gyrase subunit A
MADEDNNNPESEETPDDVLKNGSVDDAPLFDGEENIQPINVEEEMKNSFLDYSMSVIISRALPDVRDGLKPSQRRLLYAMHHDLSLSPSKKPLKCARIVGETMGKYHPHGDGAIYPTLVNMAQPWSMREILVEGQGNFGSVEGDPPAAMRYTEARLTHLGVALMFDLEKETVDFVANYDESNIEPTVLPASFPNLLVNGGTGIAVGMATNIPPHNLGEIIEGLNALIDNPEISIEGLMQFIKGPDFPTGCTICGFQGIHNYLHTGRGSVRVRGSMEVVEMTAQREQIIITEIPYNVNRATLVERIAELVNEKVLPEISAIRDESDENTRVVIDLKRDARPQVIVNMLYKHTQLETTFSTNMLAIDNRRPKLLNLKDALVCYIEHRREVIIRRTRYLLRKAEERAEGLEALLIATANLDDFIKMIRDSANREEAFHKIKKYTIPCATAEGFGIMIRGQASVKGDIYEFTDNQVNRILEMRLYQLTALERDKVKGAYDAVLEEIKDYLDILAREVRVMQIIKDELNDIKEKYATGRKTRIEADPGEINIIDLIANDGQVITLSHRGYIKRTAAIEYTSQRRGGKGVKGMATRDAQNDEDEDDFVETVFSAGAHDYLMFFTDTGRVFVERVYQIPEAGRAAKGRSVKNLLNLRPEEKIQSVLRVESIGEDDRATFDQPYYVFFATKSGKVKKTKLSEFRNFRKDGIIAINIEEGNELINVALTTGTDDICLITSGGLCVRTNEDNIRFMGRNSSGVRGIRPREGDWLVSLVVVDPDAQLLVAAQNGLGKRTPFEEYMSKGRGGKGMMSMKVTEKTGPVVGALAVKEGEDLMMITTGGLSVRTPVSEIRSIGRATQGVKLITLKKGEALQDIARVVADEESENEVIEEGVEAGSDSGSLPEPESPAAELPETETDAESTDE